LVKLSSALADVGNQQTADEQKIEYVAAANRCLTLAGSIKQWLGQELAGQVYWIEVNGERAPRITPASAPIEVGPARREQLFGEVPSVILTSATLSVGGKEGFNYFRQRLGLYAGATLQLGSPFNYPEQAELHLFRRMPDPATFPAAFEEAALAK